MQRILRVALCGAFMLSAASAESVDTPASDFAWAKLLADSGERGEAQKSFARAVAAAPDEPYLHAEFARFLWRSGQLSLAVEEIRRARQLAPGAAEIARLCGQIFFGLAERDPQSLATARDCWTALLAKSPDDLEGLVSLAQIALGGDRAADAAGLLERATAVAPAHPMILALYAEALRRSERTAEAAEVLARLVAAEPERLETRLELAELLGQRGDHRGAVAVLSAAPVEQLDSPELSRRLALELYRSGELERSRAEVDRLLTAEPGFGGGIYLRGLLEMADGHADRAAADFLRLRQEAPQAVEISLLAARALARAGRYEESDAVLSDLESRIAAAGSRAEALEVRLERVEAAARGERFERALALLDEAAAHAGQPEERADLSEARHQLLLRAGRFDEAAAALGDDDSIGALARRAEVAWRRGNESEARALLERLGEGEEPQRWMAVAQTWQRLERHAEAVPWLERAERALPARAGLLFGLGAALERSGEIGRAVEVFRRLLALEPRHAPGLNYLAYLWADRSERLEEAQALAEQAVALDPDNGAYVDTLGWTLFRRGDLASARRLLERARRLEGDDPEILEHLGDVAAAQGEREAAVAFYVRAIERGGGSDPGELAHKRDRLLDASRR